MRAQRRARLSSVAWKSWAAIRDSALRGRRRLATQRDATAKDAIAYWDVGPPSYRWQEIALDQTLRNNLPWQITIRDFALLHVAIYDAMVVAWDSKYAYNRKRPSEVDAGLVTALPNPPSPSYPAEHAVAAGAAAVLSYLFPDRAAYFAAKADEGGRSRVLVGIQYPSDVGAGLELGHKVAAFAALMITGSVRNRGSVAITGSIRALPLR